jgi:hypothetical protein
MKNLLIKKSLLLMLIIVVCSSIINYAQKKEVFVPNTSKQVLYGKVTDEKGNPLIAQVQVWYYPLTPVVFNFGDSKAKGRTDNLIKMAYTTEKGFYSVKVPADTIVLIITKGPEWSLVNEKFVIKEKEFNGIEFNVSLKRLYDLGKLGWFAGDVHSHTIHSDGYQTPSEMAFAMKGVGLSWGILSDHNSDVGNIEWLGNKDNDFVPIPGCEITTEPSDKSSLNGYGHFNQSFIQKMNGKMIDNPNIWARARFNDHSDVQKMIELTHQQNGFFAVNHPYQNWDWTGRYKSWGKVKNIDAIEVWNGEPPHSLTTNEFDTNHININTWAVHTWFEYLNSRNKLSGIAGSDCHDIYGINSYPKGKFYWTDTPGNPRTYSHLGNLSEKNIQNALVNGNLFLTSNFGPLLLFSVNDKISGEVVKVSADGTIKINVEVLANQPLLKTENGVRVIFNGKIIQNLATDSTFTFTKTISFVTDKDGWLVCEVFGQWPMYSITNPIYIDFPPYGDNFNSTWTDPVNAEKWNQFLQHPDINLSDGPTSWKDTFDSIIHKNKITVLINNN